MSQLEVDKVIPQSGTTLTLGESGDTITIASGATFTPTLTAPIIDEINDNNGNEEIIFTTTSSAVNELTIANAATGNAPEIAATGDDTDIDLKLTPKGAGNLVLDGIEFPNADGSANQALVTNGSGVLSFAAVGGTNTPAFAATKASQTLVDATATIVQVDTEVFDTDSCYDISTYKFTPDVSGKYFIYFKFYMDSNTNNRVIQIESDIMKNLSVFDRQSFLANTGAYEGGVGITQTCFAEMNGTTDFIQARVFGDVSAGDVFLTAVKFGAFKIIE